ncbi:hypothetical protein [Frigoriglobus tundricola]|uniref:Uncharacterized protein n=1 Tax=Frigoriglobus tundricola TaxID=2774151 RepID=A0A6M5YY32_9BACT|nr:hypothetical protein [Frigoriglobus tundricola]QJW98151.1 hypothetical protein FTUN_5731 [Frigoriglobus tundricola]
MTLRRLTVTAMIASGLCVWGFARSSDTPAREADPVFVETGEAHGGTHDEALARYRTNQSRHWRHVALGLKSSTP